MSIWVGSVYEDWSGESPNLPAKKAGRLPVGQICILAPRTAADPKFQGSELGRAREHTSNELAPELAAFTHCWAKSLHDRGVEVEFPDPDGNFDPGTFASAATRGATSQIRPRWRPLFVSCAFPCFSASTRKCGPSPVIPGPLPLRNRRSGANLRWGPAEITHMNRGALTPETPPPKPNIWSAIILATSARMRSRPSTTWWVATPPGVSTPPGGSSPVSAAVCRRTLLRDSINTIDGLPQDTSCHHKKRLAAACGA